MTLQDRQATSAGRLTDDGSVIYRAERDHCRRFPGPASGDLRGGPKRNFQVFGVLDFLAEVTQHIPEKGEHLVRYFGWYSHRQRGIRKHGQPAKRSNPGLMKMWDGLDDWRHRNHPDFLSFPHGPQGQPYVSPRQAESRSREASPWVPWWRETPALKGRP